MSKDIGIEEARKTLGDIADHVHTTGNTINLTRHGKAIAVIGPTTTTRPTQGIEVFLHFPHSTIGARVHLPAVPHKGDLIGWEADGQDTGMWQVQTVEWTADDSGEVGLVGVILKPAPDDE